MLATFVQLLLGLILGVLSMGIGIGVDAEPVTSLPPMPTYAPSNVVARECLCDDCCYDQAYLEYADEFTALFNSYEVKRAKNGALMIRSGNAGSYRFAKKG